MPGLNHLSVIQSTHILTALAGFGGQSQRIVVAEPGWSLGAGEHSGIDTATLRAPWPPSQLEPDQLHGDACAYLAQATAPAASVFMYRWGGATQLVTDLADWLRPGDVVSLSQGVMGGLSYEYAGCRQWTELVASGIHVVLSSGNSGLRYDDYPQYACDSGAVVVAGCGVSDLGPAR